MNLLLDTHVLLWALAEPGKLGRDVRGKLESADNTVFVSAVSMWEIEIKRRLRKLRAPDDLEDQLRAVRFTELAVNFAHVRAIRDLPNLHRDPFDRMLVAQARAEDLTIVTRDRQVAAYPVETLVVQ